jgi:cobalt-zinc-cadmium efflux system outer membrane protein
MRTSTNRRTVPALRALSGAVVLLALSACASVAPRQQLPAVEQQVGARLDQKVSWNQGREEDRQAEAMVRRLLAEPLSADAAVQIALLNNRRLQATYERLGIAQADLVQAGLLDNPSLSAQHLFGDEGDLFEVAVMQPFLEVFTLSARKKIGAAEATRASLEVAHEVTDLAARVRETYFALLADSQALELFRHATVASEAAADLAARQYAAGTLSKREQTVQQAFYAQTIVEAARAEAQLAADREKLNRLLGLYGELTRWRMPERLPGLPAEVPAVDDVEAAAIAQRLDLAAANAEVEVLARAAGLTRSTRWLSALGIGVAYKREPDGEKLFGPEMELTVPLFDQGQARVARVEAQLREAQRQLEQLAIEVRSQAREALLRLQAAHAVAIHYRDALLPLQQTVVGETLKFYNGMLVGVYDLLLARQAQVQTARDAIAASREFWLAWAELERAVGGRVPLPATQTTPPPPGGLQPADPLHHQHGEQ